MKKLSIIAGFLALAFCVGILAGASEAVLAQGHGCGPDGKGFWSNLTDEQRQAVQDKKEEMRSQGATREEIRAAVAEMLKGYGIELPEQCRVLGGPGGLRHDRGGFMTNLTDEQREAVQEKTKEMRSQGATREEIRSAKAEMLKGYGVELPEDWREPDGPGGFGPGPGDFWKNLTDEQGEAVRQKIEEMRSQDATPEEIHSAVVEMLKGYGIELPEQCHLLGGPGGLGHDRIGFMTNLTDEQREVVRQKIEEMRNQDATPEEIHSAVAEMLKGYGIEVPENWRGPDGPDGLGPGPGGFLKDLTEEQRDAVHEKMKEMRDQGATREEIHSAVAEMLKGYGVKLPENSQSTSPETTPAEIHIVAGSYPNPFNPETQITYTLSAPENVKIQIYNVSGQLIRTFDAGYQSTGNHIVRWDGRNENGDPTASGIYLYRIDAGPYSVTNRMVLLK